MKIALLHLDVAEGPETRNRRSIISAAGLKQRFRDISSMTTMGSFLPFRKSSCPGTCFLPEGIKRICFFPQQNMMKGMERDTIPVLS